MSETALMLKPDTLLQDNEGLLTYRTAFTTLRVIPRRDGDVQLLVMEDGHLIQFDLSSADVDHLINLLRPGKN